MKRHSLIFIALVLPSLLLLYQLYCVFSKKELTISPASTHFSFRAYNDTADGGLSEITHFYRDSSTMNLDFVLRKGFDFPFSGIAVEPLPAGSTLDLSGYDYLSVKISRNITQDIKIHLRTHVDGHTNPANAITQRFLELEVNCLEPEQTFKIPLNKFVTPLWWYYQNNLQEEDIGKETFKKVLAIIFQSGTSTQIDQMMKIKISQISFKIDTYKRLFFVLFFCLTYYGTLTGLYFIFLRIRKKDIQIQRMEISYKPLSVNNYLDEDSRRIVDYISVHYCNPDLSLDTVAHEVGMGLKKISRILNATLQCNFKQYLNKIRITEAKRLLIQTDRHIADISRKVGYHNVTHFNRTFKLLEGISPNQFRTNSEKSRE